MLKIVFIALNVFILKTVDKTWTSRAVPDVLVKTSLVSEERVAVVTVESFFSLCICPFLLIMRSKCRFQIIQEVVIIIVFEACSTIDKKIDREIILSPAVLIQSCNSVHAVKLVRNTRSYSHLRFNFS